MYFGTFSVPERKTNEKKLGYYEIENIDNPCLLLQAVNPRVSRITKRFTIK